MAGAPPGASAIPSSSRVGIRSSALCARSGMMPETRTSVTAPAHTNFSWKFLGELECGGDLGITRRSHRAQWHGAAGGFSRRSRFDGVRRQRLCRIVRIGCGFTPVAVLAVAAAMEHRLVGKALGPQKFLELDQPSVESGARSWLRWQWVLLQATDSVTPKG